MLTRQTLYVQRNIKGRSYNHCCSGKAVTITYSECVFVTLVIQHATRMRRTVTCGLCGSTIYIFFSHYLVNGTIFEKVIENTMCVLNFCTKFF